jgi:Domain of unknown function (DUF4249)
MKNILALFALIFLTSCEDVVDIDLDTAAPKLVIDANILWQKGTAGNEQRIKLSTTTGFYSTEIPTVSNATVFVTNSSATVFTFTEIVPNTGEYICLNFVPVVNETYTLTVIVNGVTYTATETLLATPDIDYVEQTTVQGIGGDLLQVKFFFQDNGLEDNNYLIIVKKSDEVIPELGSISDEFFQGNQMFGFYSDDELEAGDQLTFGLQAMSLRYYNYMNKLINIVGSTGNPFATPPATLRGNIINQTDANNYPLGYFHMSEVDTEDYTIQ